MKVLLGVLFCFCTVSLHAQQESTQSPIRQVISQVEPYGSIRMGAGFTDEGEAGVTDNASRVGFTLKHFISEESQLAVVGRVEMGLNLVNRDETIEFAPGANPGVTQAGDAVFARIGYLGVAYKNFQITFGKQNSVYYTLGAIESVDRLYAFGGVASGVWNIADGGISGTGRANRAIVLTYKIKGLQLGAQVQARNISENSTFADSYGFGANYAFGSLGIGIGYNKVEDGVDDPNPNQAASGDEALVTSASYEKDRLTVAASFARMNNHLRTSGIFYNANGYEFYVGYIFSQDKKWKAATGYTWIEPDADQELGAFDRKFAVLELSYTFKPGGNIFATAQLEQSNEASGEINRPHAFGIGFRFGF